MSSYFFLTLDTTGPIIKIYAPNYTNTETENTIIIEGNENLLDGEVYFIDSLGNRKDYIFAKTSDNTYEGIIRLNDVAEGIGVLYARFKDEVSNISALVSKAINVFTNSDTIVNIQDKILTEIKANDKIYTVVNTVDNQYTHINASSTPHINLNITDTPYIEIDTRDELLTVINLNDTLKR